MPTPFEPAADTSPPEPGPLVKPADAVAIALNMVRWVPGRLHGPEDRVVTLIIQSIEKSGWEIVPR